MTGTIYALSDCQGARRYVGQTRTPVHYRVNRHVADARRGRAGLRVTEWIRSIDYQVVSEVLEVVQESDLDERERYWIARLKAEGCRLVNSTDGGNGHTPMSIAKLSEALKGRPKSAEHRAAMSAARSTPEQRALQAERNRRRFADPAARQRMAEATRARFADPAERQKVAAVNRRRFEDPSERMKVSVLRKGAKMPSRKGVTLSDETKSKLRAARAAYLSRVGSSTQAGPV